MTAIDSQQLADQVDYTLPPDRLRIQVKGVIEDAVAAAKGSVIEWRACPSCHRLFKVGPYSVMGCSGTAKIYCCGACRLREFRNRAKCK